MFVNETNRELLRHYRHNNNNNTTAKIFKNLNFFSYSYNLCLICVDEVFKMYISLFVKRMIDTKYYVKQQLINGRLRSFHFEPININLAFLQISSKKSQKKTKNNNNNQKFTNDLVIWQHCICNKQKKWKWKLNINNISVRIQVFQIKLKN